MPRAKNENHKRPAPAADNNNGLLQNVFKGNSAIQGQQLKNIYMRRRVA